MKTSRSREESAQDDLFSSVPVETDDQVEVTPTPAEPDEPKPNSPEDLGLIPRARVYGEPSEDSEPVEYVGAPRWHEDASTFVRWIHAQELEVHADVRFGVVFRDLSGLSQANLRWLCQACRQAGRAPEPWKMKRAALARDVGLLRPGASFPIERT